MILLLLTCQLVKVSCNFLLRLRIFLLVTLGPIRSYTVCLARGAYSDKKSLSFPVSGWPQSCLTGTFCQKSWEVRNWNCHFIAFLRRDLQKNSPEIPKSNIFWLIFRNIHQWWCGAYWNVIWAEPGKFCNTDVCFLLNNIYWGRFSL